MRILIVEDEEHLADGLRFNLEADGYEVETAYNGESALDKFFVENKSFDAIVLDVMMPRKNGFEVARALREAENFTPILMLTAKSQEADKIRGLDAGADDYVTKPFSVGELVARIGAHIGPTRRPAAAPPVSKG